MGFEPTRAEPSGFRVHLLNHSDTLSDADLRSPRNRIPLLLDVAKILSPRIELGTFRV